MTEQHFPELEVPVRVEVDPRTGEVTLSNDELRIAAAGRTEAEAREHFAAAFAALREAGGDD